ncbi:MAG: hypothetical protein QE285_21675 [Aquabacterium sp.]|nr:hypothetical protein [Aquabacterium sp.]
MTKILTPLLLALLATSTTAKLPAPNDEAKAKAAEAAAKTAHAGKVDSYKLCLAMDKVAAGHQAAAKKAGKPAPAPTDTPACADPGPFVIATAGAAPAPVVAAAPAAPAAAAKK